MKTLPWSGRWPDPHYPAVGTTLRYRFKHSDAVRAAQVRQVWCGIEPVIDLDNGDKIVPSLDPFEVLTAGHVITDQQVAATNIRQMLEQNLDLKHRLQDAEGNYKAAATELASAKAQVNTLEWERHNYQKAVTALTDRVEALEAALRSLIKIADEAYGYWDTDADSRVGKLLLAMAGHRPKYRADIDAVHAVLKTPEPPSYRAAETVEMTPEEVALLRQDFERWVEAREQTYGPLPPDVRRLLLPWKQ